MCHLRPHQATSVENKAIKALEIKMTAIDWPTESPKAISDQKDVSFQGSSRTQVSVWRLPITDV